MYLILLFVLGLAASSYQHHHRDHTQHRVEYLANIFEELANDVIALDRQSIQLCEAHSIGSIKELFEEKRFSLKISLQGFNDSDVTVQVRHRVMYVNAVNKDPVKHFSAIKELPAFVNVAEGKFDLQDGVLEVVFPTRNVLNNSCDPHLNVDVVTLTKFEQFSGQTGPR
ncbi:uncharacterized protein LOC114353759 [Ostrinia furnacalis]|uniref:uncharacterized protein LOC114353759 n=1 Tax=Ostrinia furnacalis TaxID=93504 RepID=UPI00103DFAE7|nr:uncharacterized protein LOC114353759 [Ostrinia furnacalis]